MTPSPTSLVCPPYGQEARCQPVHDHDVEHGTGTLLYLYTSYLTYLTLLVGYYMVWLQFIDRLSERNSHRRSPFTLGHHLPTVGAESEA